VYPDHLSRNIDDTFPMLLLDGKAMVVVEALAVLSKASLIFSSRSDS
jgi:hypothetical protein